MAVPYSHTFPRKPSPHLPAGGGEAVEAKIIESLADPAQRPLTVGDRCALIGVSRSTWYRHMEDPLLAARARRAYRDCCGNELGRVLQALIQSAVIEGKDGHPDRKLYLELLGEYEPRSRVKIEEGPQKTGAEMSDGELLAAFEGREHLLPPGVQRRLGRETDARK